VGESVLVRSGDTEFFVEVGEGSGVQTVGLDGSFSLEGVRETLEAVARELAEAWEKARPSEASVEFGLRLTARTGKLTGLIVDGGGEAALKVSLLWKKEG
jgi:hypothetical protein